MADFLEDLRKTMRDISGAVRDVSRVSRDVRRTADQVGRTVEVDPFDRDADRARQQAQEQRALESRDGSAVRRGGIQEGIQDGRLPAPVYDSGQLQGPSSGIPHGANLMNFMNPDILKQFGYEPPGSEFGRSMGLTSRNEVAAYNEAFLARFNGSRAPQVSQFASPAQQAAPAQQAPAAVVAPAAAARIVAQRQTGGYTVVEETRQLQTLMGKIGIDAGPVDGKFGPKTQAGLEHLNQITTAMGYPFDPTKVTSNDLAVLSQNVNDIAAFKRAGEQASAQVSKAPQVRPANVQAANVPVPPATPSRLAELEARSGNDR